MSRGEAAPLLALRGASLGFGGAPVLADADIAIGAGDRICLVGRNGGGKSTLLRALAGRVELDRGERFLQPGTRIGYLPQEPAMPTARTIREHVAGAGDDHGGPAPEAWQVDAMLAAVGLDGGRRLGSLSGGEARRTALARALAGRPDILLLDEPTNHLDLPAIEWLEAELARYPGGLLLVSHDRALLTRLSRRTAWIERGRLRHHPGGFAGFPAWSETVLAEEAAALDRLDRRIAGELRWLREGLTARRRRNQGRLRRLEAMRQERRDWRGPAGTAAIATGSAEAGGKLVIEARNLCKRYEDGDGGETVIARGFSTLIRRGDRIGVIGRNGAGKTALIRMLIGREPPDRGHVRLGAGVRAVYFDQRRESLDPEATPWSTLCPGGGDMLHVHGRQRHVAGYLRDFLFADAQFRSPLKALSGGERNRLLLARLFAQPHNLLVLDEPTNDLDMETLELLEEVLAAYDGTVLLVSHDRALLDRVVTATIAVEGSGVILEYPGGHTDYLAQRPAPAAETGRPARLPAAGQRRQARPATRMSYRDQRELDRLPGEIEALEAEAKRLEARLADPDLFARDAGAVTSLGNRLATARAELAAAETRWLALAERQEELAARRAG